MWTVELSTWYPNTYQVRLMEGNTGNTVLLTINMRLFLKYSIIIKLGDNLWLTVNLHINVIKMCEALISKAADMQNLPTFQSSHFSNQLGISEIILCPCWAIMKWFFTWFESHAVPNEIETEVKCTRCLPQEPVPIYIYIFIFFPFKVIANWHSRLHTCIISADL